MSPAISVIVPTLAADDRILGCLAALRAQTWPDFETIVVDSSGQCRLRARGGLALAGLLVEMPRRAGFAAAANAGLRRARAPLVALLNDDAYPEPAWLAALAAAARRHPEAGMFASRIVLTASGLLDSAGMLLCPDGSSRQRGHGCPPAQFAAQEEVLLPSACAALYRRAMLADVGLFDESFGMYCEDTDLGLRGRWAGWSCIYAPAAVVRHDYSASAGAASAAKAWAVERNRLRLALRCLPCSMLALAPWTAFQRYLHHAAGLCRGNGAAARYRGAGGRSWRLFWYVLRAHLAALAALPALLRQRRAIRRRARISPAAFRALARRHCISPAGVARL